MERVRYARSIVLARRFIFQNAIAANANSASVEWSTADIINLSPMSPSNDVLNVLHEQTSRLLADSYDAIAEQTRRIRNQIEDWSAAAASNAYEYEYLKNALDTAAAAVPLSGQELQIIDDAVSMLGANYAYDAAQREINLHRDCIAAAYKDLSSAAHIVIDGSTTDVSTSTLQRMRQVQQHVLSAVGHLRDSCPLCRALKYAASDANQHLLPFVTVLCSSVLKTLHPFVTDP